MELTVTKTKPCFKGCGRQAKPRVLLGQSPDWYAVPEDEAGRTVHLCGKCFKPAKEAK